MAVRLGILISFVIMAGAFSLGALWYVVSNHGIDISVLERYDPGSPSLLLDDQGVEWARFQLDRRDPVSIVRMPQHLLDAFIAAEDWKFFSHHGISWKGIFRSLMVNLYHGKKVQGASTITQQLVKLLFFDSSKTFSRKIKEQLYAIIIDQQFSKHQIIEIYLNHVYFGCGIYGVQAAAQRFWGKNVEHLSIDEAASLAAIIRNPSYYCPLLYPLSNEQRRNLIIKNMQHLGLISAEQYRVAVATPLVLKAPKEQVKALYFKEYIRLILEEKFGRSELYTGGLIIQTTLNQSMQKEAEQHFTDNVSRLAEELKKPVDGALIALDVASGGIKAMVGGKDFKSSQFNRALQARRQMGSIFKPIIYAAAIESGMSFADVVVDEPIEVLQEGVSWSPNNFNCKFSGPITRAYALSHSNNIIAIKTLLDTGIDEVIELAEKCRLSGPFNPYPSLALGCIDATLKESAGMFNIFANDGVYVEPHAIVWVKDRWGKKLYKVTPEKERILSSVVNSKVAKALGLSIERVHTWFDDDQWIDMEAISKTGTTNDSRTCWYVGSSPQITTAIYIGCDDNRPLGKNIYPLKTAFPIWLGFNRAISSSVKKFSYDPTLVPSIIHERTGKPVYAEHPEAVEIFR